MKTFKLIVFAMALSFAFNVSAQVEKLPQPKFPTDMSLMNCLNERRTIRDFVEEEISVQEIANMLWAAYGVNRPEESKLTVPSARNVQEIDVYLFTEKGVYIYNSYEHTIELIQEGDYRAKISSQKHFSVAPVSVVLVANYGRMKGFDKESLEFYSAIDCGYVSQNIYLYCASSERMGTVACGAINRDEISTILGLKNAKPLLAHPFGVATR